MPDRTVGEIVAENPSQARVFQVFGIDFCCQGGRTLREACEKKNIDLATVTEQLEAATAAPHDSRGNPAKLQPVELIDYIIDTHHDFMRTELPRIDAMADRVATVHGGHTPSLVTVRSVFHEMAQELSDHMMKEEQILFPAIQSLASGNGDVIPLDGPVACMLKEHESAGDALKQLRELTHGFTPPEGACNTYRALFAGLSELEEDLHRHIHLENSVLFPAAQAMVQAGS